MNANAAIESAIGKLANTMRLYVDSYMRFGDLFSDDREEAIDNLDRAFDAKLEAFHALYDVSKTRFPYFDHGDTALLIAVRNAIHHRDYPLFRSFYARLFLDDDLLKWSGASFLLARHPTHHGAPLPMTHYLRLDDIDARLNPAIASPFRDTTLKNQKAEQRFALIEGDLAFAELRQKAFRDRYPGDQVYLDMMPVFVSAVCRVFRAMKAAGIVFKGFDAETYMVPFTSELEIDLTAFTYQVERVA